MSGGVSSDKEISSAQNFEATCLLIVSRQLPSGLIGMMRTIPQVLDEQEETFLSVQHLDSSDLQLAMSFPNIKQ